MKVIKRLISWAILSLILQFAGLFILDSFVFKHSSDFKMKKVETNVADTKNVNATISSEAEDVKISYDGRYLTYNLNNKVYIEDTSTNEKSEIKTENKGEILYYKWLSDRDRIVIAEKVHIDGIEKIKLVTYDPTNKTQSDVSEVCRYRDDMEVKKISVSVLTGVYYVDIDRGGMRSTVYRIDINHDLTRVNLRSEVLGNMKVIPRYDRLIYEDELNNTFYATSPSKRLVIKSDKELALLGIDAEGVIYIGEITADKVSKIIYGTVDEDTSTWKNMELAEVVNPTDIYFNSKSEILINDNLQGIVKNLTTGKMISYDGKLIEIKEKFIATVVDEKLSYTSLTEE
ncbi:dipeptidyl-peptidase IV [Clostridium taeniosporum]|uniref:Dipeptidyl-peptidase IV n=1 Tax=Clostridium taeniosporum TaxID=394958 RepID=A0A1D7XL44_9CLOT|nr:dipeptidyl-peptidase IV [Clostridium taeniosporum]AOR24073.1 dipeptidyl-peptidase IV [Clostridium taeniosporum]